MFSPKVSVIIPTYNRANILGQAIKSVLAQTYSDYELIVIDDGSTDDTRKIIEAFSGKVLYLWQSNKGVSSARNHGIRMSRGDYIAFLDSDDSWSHDKLDLQVKYLDSHPGVGLVFADAVLEHENGGEFQKRSDLVYRGGSPSLKHLLLANPIPCLTVMVRRQCLDEVGLFDESLTIGEDYDLWLRVSKRCHIGHIGKVLAHYRVHSSNALGVDIDKMFEQHLAIVVRNLDEDTQSKYGISQNKVLADIAISYGLAEFNLGRFTAAKRKMYSALKYHQFHSKALYYLLAINLKSWCFQINRGL